MLFIQLFMEQNSQTRLASAVGYVGVLFLIPLFFFKESPFAQYHGKQGLILFIAWAVNSVIMIIPVLGWLVSFFGSIALFIISVIAFLKAYSGEEWELPYIGKYAKKVKI